MAQIYLKDDECDTVEAELALDKLAEITWEKLKSLSNVCMEPTTGFRCDWRSLKLLQRMFTYEEARSLVAPQPKPSKTKKSRKAKNSAGALSITCMLCKEAGLKGLQIAHRTEDCDPRLRQKNINKLRSRTTGKKAKFAGPNSSPKKRRKDNSTGHAKPECNNCKLAGRSYWHDPKKCNYAPGGAWFGLTGESLKEAQRKTYQDARDANKNKASTSGAFKKYRSKSIRKMRASSLKITNVAGKPYWMQ